MIATSAHILQDSTPITEDEITVEPSISIHFTLGTSQHTNVILNMKPSIGFDHMFQLTAEDVASIGGQINNMLFRCKLRLTLNPPEVEDALELAEEALSLAKTWDIHGKFALIQFYRGECFKLLENWEAAHEAFEKIGPAMKDPSILPELLEWCREMMEESKTSTESKTDTESKGENV